MVVTLVDDCILQYQNADHWYHNLDKLIHYININASNGGPVVAFYSTPSYYTDMKHAATKKAMVYPTHFTAALCCCCCCCY